MKTKAKRGSARDLFEELSEGMEALADTGHGKRTLRTHVVKLKPAPNVTPRTPKQTPRPVRKIEAHVQTLVCANKADFFNNFVRHPFNLGLQNQVSPQNSNSHD